MSTRSSQEGSGTGGKPCRIRKPLEGLKGESGERRFWKEEASSTQGRNYKKAGVIKDDFRESGILFSGRFLSGGRRGLKAQSSRKEQQRDMIFVPY